MKELMLHVERIVRPVRAVQGRKLRMRGELLAHLQAALEEERARFPDDERAALEHATRRLGDPAALTAQLQGTIPKLESVLLTNVPVSPRVDQLDEGMLYGRRGALTLGHATILNGIVLLVGVPFLMSIYSAVMSVDRQPVHLMLSLVGALLGWYALWLASYRFVFAAARPDHRLHWRGTLQRGGAILALQIGLTCFVAFAVANRAATLSELVTCVTSTLVVLAASALIARRIGVLRPRYGEWLTLDIAELSGLPA